MPKKPAPKKIRTFQEARAYVARVGICGIFSEIEGESLWSVVDLPGRIPGQKGWGEKVTAIWTWKNELPARYPREFFYGKIPGGLAALMTVAYLKKTHYPAAHKPIRECTPMAQKLYGVIVHDPITTKDLRRELDMTRPPERNRCDRALQELQTTLNIVRRNSLKDAYDTWVPFREQYLEIASAAEG